MTHGSVISAKHLVPKIQFWGAKPSNQALANFSQTSQPLLQISISTAMCSSPTFHLRNTLPPITLSSLIKGHPRQPSTPSSPSTTPPSTATSTTNIQLDKAHEMHFGRDAVIVGAAGLAEHEHKKHHRRNNTVDTRSTRPTLMTRLRGRNANTQTVNTTTAVEPGSARTTRPSRWNRSGRTAGEPVVHHRRHASIRDKISGAMLKLKGSLTHRPGAKVLFFSWVVTVNNIDLDAHYSLGCWNEAHARHWRSWKPSSVLSISIEWWICMIIAKDTQTSDGDWRVDFLY